VATPIRLALWFCAFNLLAAALAAQCSNPTQVPNQTISSGAYTFSDSNALSASGVVINGSASVTFTAGNCIQLLPGFDAKAGSAGTTFHAQIGTPPQYSLTTAVSPSGAGTISPSCSSGCAENTGTVVQVSASAASGYVFSGFSGNLSGTTTPQNLTMSGNESVTANFTPVPTITSISPTSGAVGTNVTITGTGFGTSGTVAFAGTSAQIIPTWTATQIVAQVPSGASTGTITVSTGGYQTGYYQQQFQVTPTESVTVNPATVTLGQSQTQQFTASQSVTWSISPTEGIMSSTGLYTAPATITAQKTVTVTATSVAPGPTPGTAIITLTPPPTITSLSLSQGPPQMGFTISGANFGAAPAQACAYAPPVNPSQNGCVILTGVPGGNIPLTVINNSWSAGSIVVQLPATTPAPAAGQTTAGQVYAVTATGAQSNSVTFTVTGTFGCGN
jgi:hypothetical protein